jgi:tetratricopeptide (TPR) repeat protein
VWPANTPYTEAMTHFARAIGAARSGRPDAATPDIDRLGELAAALEAMKDEYWAEQVGIQRRIALAWQMFARGQRREAIAALREAADAEDRTDKSAISPGPLAPARELLGEMLLEAGDARAALDAFEATMKKEPNRFRGTYGAARAASRAGDRQKAVAYYTQLLEIAREADTERPELVEARTYVASQRSRQ